MLCAVQRKFFSYTAILLLLSLLPGKQLLASNKTPEATPHSKPVRFYNPLTRSWLSRDQIRLLNIAHRIGMEDANKEHASLLQAIMMQESHAGRFGRIGDTEAPMGKRSYGVMQIKLVTARDVLRRHPELGQFDTEEALLIRLVTDDHFNISIASKHLLNLRKHTNRDAQAVMAYNTGLKKAKKHWYPEKFRYVKKIRRYVSKVITPFNKRFGNQHPQVAFLN